MLFQVFHQSPHCSFRTKHYQIERYLTGKSGNSVVNSSTSIIRDVQISLKLAGHTHNTGRRVFKFIKVGLDCYRNRSQIIARFHKVGRNDCDAVGIHCAVFLPGNCLKRADLIQLIACVKAAGLNFANELLIQRSFFPLQFSRVIRISQHMGIQIGEAVQCHIQQALNAFLEVCGYRRRNKTFHCLRIFNIEMEVFGQTFLVGYVQSPVILDMGLNHRILTQFQIAGCSDNRCATLFFHSSFTAGSLASTTATEQHQNRQHRAKYAFPLFHTYIPPNFSPKIKHAVTLQQAQNQQCNCSQKSRCNCNRQTEQETLAAL